MTVFMILMIAGLFGMFLMAIPGLSRHGHSGMGGHGAIAGAHGTALPHGAGHAGAHAPALAQGAKGAAPIGHGTHGSPGAGSRGSGNSADWLIRLAQPRILFGLLALYGAFGYLFTETHLLGPWPAAIAAALPALLLERYAVTPLWNALLGFQGKPASPLQALLLTEAVAVTPFRNGKGIVTVQRDGRTVQLTAHLASAQASMPVQVGDRLRVEEIDAARERVTVSLS